MGLKELSLTQLILAGALLATVIVMVVVNARLTKKVRNAHSASSPDGSSPIRSADYYTHWELYLGMLLMLFCFFLFVSFLATNGCNWPPAILSLFGSLCSAVAPLWSK